MFRVAFRITESEADAQEVAQEAFLRGYRSLAAFDERSEFRTWIYRITVNCALQVLNKRKTEAPVPMYAISNDHAAMLASAGGSDDTA